jgi:hypothetical protein
MTANRAEVTVREFVSGDENAFRRLNEEWIVRYFKLEEKDLEAFANPRRRSLTLVGASFLPCVAANRLACAPW